MPIEISTGGKYVNLTVNDEFSERVVIVNFVQPLFLRKDGTDETFKSTLHALVDIYLRNYFDLSLRWLLSSIDENIEDWVNGQDIFIDDFNKKATYPRDVPTKDKYRRIEGKITLGQIEC
jgi:hypothetical protein